MKSCKSQTKIERARDAAQAKRKAKVLDIEALVCSDIIFRQKNKGIPKYGMTVAENPLPQQEWLIHLYYELLDAAIYAKRQIVGNQQEKEPNETKNKGKNLSRHHSSGDGNGNVDIR